MKYSGMWKAGMHHVSVFLKADDSFFSSLFLLFSRQIVAVLQGEGEHVWPDGAVYTGQWENHKM